MIAYTGASLFLLIQMHAFDERATWIRRRIGDPSTISALYLRGGTVFIVSAMAVSLLLTNRAASAPLAGAWSGVGDRLVDMGEEISRCLPLGGAVRPLGKLQFGEHRADLAPRGSATTRSRSRPPCPRSSRRSGGRRPTTPYQGTAGSRRAGHHDPFGRRGRSRSSTAPREKVEPALTEQLTVTVTPSGYGEDLLLAPGAPVAVDRATNVLLFGDDEWFAGAELGDGAGGPYKVTAAALKIATRPTDGGRHHPEQAQGRRPAVYPPEIRRPVHGRARRCHRARRRSSCSTILQGRPSRRPVRPRRHDGGLPAVDGQRFTYDIDLTERRLRRPGAVECFARIKQRVLPPLRVDDGDPAARRDPGQPDPDAPRPGLPARARRTAPRRRCGSATRTPGSRSTSRATAGSRSTPRRSVGQPDDAPGRPAGAAGASQLPPPSFAAAATTDPEPRSRRPVAPPAPTSGGRQRARRPGAADRCSRSCSRPACSRSRSRPGSAGPRGEVGPDAAWRTMSRTASRFGLRAAAHPDGLRVRGRAGRARARWRSTTSTTVATAKVETSYAGARLGGARLDEVRGATAGSGSRCSASRSAGRGAAGAPDPPRAPA